MKLLYINRYISSSQSLEMNKLNNINKEQGILINKGRRK